MSVRPATRRRSALVVALASIFLACGARDRAVPIASPVAAWARAPGRVRLVIDHIDRVGGDLAESGFIDLYVDVLDEATGRAVRDQPGDTIALSIDGQYQPGTFEVRTFAEADRAMGVALLFAVHAGYGPMEALDEAPLVTIERGIDQLLATLSERDRVSIYAYDENEREALPTPDHTPRSFLPIADHVHLRGDRDARQVPEVYPAIRGALEGVAADAPNLPARRVLIVISDGADRASDARRDQQIQAIVDLALAPEVDAPVHVIGFTLGNPERLTPLAELAARTQGSYRFVDFDQSAELDDAIAELGRALRRQYVIRFRPTDYRGAREPRTLELALLTRDGRFGLRALDAVRFAPQ